MPGQPKATDKAAVTRERIVAAARELLVEQDYDSVSTAALIERAGVSRGGLYHHFAGKDELMLAVFEAIENDLMRDLAASAAAEPSPIEQLRAGAAAYLDASMESEELQRISLRHARRVLDWKSWHEMAMRHGLGLATTTVREAVEAGEIETDEPAALAHMVVATIIEAGIMIAFSEDQPRERRRVGTAIDALITGLRTG